MSKRGANFSGVGRSNTKKVRMDEYNETLRADLVEYAASKMGGKVHDKFKNLSRDIDSYLYGANKHLKDSTHHEKVKKAYKDLVMKYSGGFKP